jgi:hypothetical protein
MGQAVRSFAALALLLALAAPVRAADAAAVTGTAQDATDAPVWSDHGFEYGLRLSALSVFNGSPLAYGPIDLGWRFGNGVRIRTGLSLFYYTGLDSDSKQPDLGSESYYYEMVDWRLSTDYVVALPFKVKPVVGISVDLISGTRSRSVPQLRNTPKLAAWSMVAPGALLGLDWRGGEHWSTDLQVRFSHGFTEIGPVISTDLTWRYLL